MADSVCTRTPAQSPDTIFDRWADEGAAARAAQSRPQAATPPGDLSPKNEQKSQPWTPAHHVKDGITKPVRLLALGHGEHGPCGRFEFPGGWERVIDLPTEADAYHPLFDGLPYDQRQQMHRHVQPDAVPSHDGVRKVHSPLSFTTSLPTVRGYTKDHKYFDVPAQPYGEGYVTGYECAAELLQHLARGHGPHIPLYLVLQEACAASQEPHNGPSRRGAGVAFMTVVEEALRFLGKHGNHRQFIAARIDQAETSLAWQREREAEEKAAFVERMRQARAAKRAERAAATLSTPTPKKTWAERAKDRFRDHEDVAA